MLYFHSADMAMLATRIARENGYHPTPGARQRAVRWATPFDRDGTLRWSPKRRVAAAMSLYYLLAHDLAETADEWGKEFFNEA